MSLLWRVLTVPAQIIVFVMLLLTAPIWIGMLVHFVKHLDA